MRRRGRLLLAVASLLLAACASGGGEGGEGGVPVVQTPTAGGGAEPGSAVMSEPGEDTADTVEADEVVVQGFRFEPAAVRIDAGTAVTWSNEDAVGHTVTAGTSEAPETSRFDLDLVAQGARASHTFTEPGRYAYFCELHPSMTGEVVVG